MNKEKIPSFHETNEQKPERMLVRHEALFQQLDRSTEKAERQSILDTLKEEQPEVERLADELKRNSESRLAEALDRFHESLE